QAAARVLPLHYTPHLLYNACRHFPWVPMVISSTIINKPLPQEMEQHTYSIMRQAEGAHWWYVGRRRIIESFLNDICTKLDTARPHILDVGCVIGANLEMLAHFDDSDGVDFSLVALSLCRVRW